MTDRTLTFNNGPLLLRGGDHVVLPVSKNVKGLPWGEDMVQIPYPFWAAALVHGLVVRSDGEVLGWILSPVVH